MGIFLSKKNKGKGKAGAEKDSPGKNFYIYIWFTSSKVQKCFALPLCNSVIVGIASGVCICIRDKGFFFFFLGCLLFVFFHD